jgi:CheY-like chemotaxis protein
MILTDVEMPEMDGYILTKHIKADPALRRHSGGDALVAVVRFRTSSSAGRSVSMNTCRSSRHSGWPKRSPA